MKKDERARLEKAIEQIGAGNILMFLDEPDGRERLLGWLTELRSLVDEREARATAESMRTLQDFYGLKEDEAKRVLSQLHAGKGYETEEGPCRKCEGTGKVEVFVRSTCFGSDTRNEDCMLCRGKGVDPKRIKVPEAEVLEA